MNLKTAQHKRSQFVMRISHDGMEIVEGNPPTKDGQLFNGEIEGTGEKMQLAGNSRGAPTAYWGW